MSLCWGSRGNECPEKEEMRPCSEKKGGDKITRDLQVRATGSTLDGLSESAFQFPQHTIEFDGHSRRVVKL